VGVLFSKKGCFNQARESHAKLRTELHLAAGSIEDFITALEQKKQTEAPDVESLPDR
jgi:hypothetical protein